MLKKILKVALVVCSSLVVAVTILMVYFNLPVQDVNTKAKLGVTFSSRYAKDIDIDWKEAYIAMLDDLGIKRVRIPVYWDLVEPEEGMYDFSDVEWQLKEAEKRKVDVILSMGQKVPRWPECFVPEWAAVSDEKRKESLVKFVSVVSDRLKTYSAVKYWQVENEPFLDFGVCPAPDATLVDQEIAAVRKNDPTRKIMVTDGGEMSFWVSAAKRSDIFGTTMYREVVNKRLGAWEYPIGPNFFKAKKVMVRVLANQKNVVVIELQGEPWLQGWTTGFPLEDQLGSMNAEKLADNVQFAKNGGFSEVYMWGVEWWYYLKVKHNYPLVWDTVKNLVKENI